MIHLWEVFFIIDGNKKNPPFFCGKSTEKVEVEDDKADNQSLFSCNLICLGVNYYEEIISVIIDEEILLTV